MKRKALTTVTAITRPTENICGNSTCPKTPQYFKEGRLKPFFANNVDIPFARARRLRPCPRKASARSDPGRRELHYLAASNPTVTSQFIDFVSKLTILFGGTSNAAPNLEKRAVI